MVHTHVSLCSRQYDLHSFSKKKAKTRLKGMGYMSAAALRYRSEIDHCQE